MSLRKICLAPFLVKKPPIFKQCLCTYYMSHAENTGNENKALAITRNNKDMLSVELDTLSSSRILLTLKNNTKLINGSHLVFAMTKFHKLYRRKLSDQEDGSGFWNNTDTKEMCSLIDLNVDKLTVSESIKLLRMFYKMKAPGTMKVMNSLFKHINDSAKDLSFLDFHYLSRAFKQIPESSLTIELNSTLKRKFIIKVATEFDADNIVHLTSALYFTANNLGDNNKLLKLFIDGLNNYKGEIPSKNAISIFHSLHLIKQYPPGWLNVLQRIQNILIDNVDELQADQIRFFIYILGEEFRLNRRDEFYNETLCDVLVKKLIKEDISFETALSALKSLSYVRFTSKELLNYSCAAYFQRISLSNEVIQDEFFKLVSLINCLSMVKHKTVFFDEIKDRVLNSKLVTVQSYESLCILAFNLINLDCYNNELLTKVFDGKSNYAEKSFLQWKFCKIYQKIKTSPTYKGPLPSESQLMALKEFHYERYLHKKKNNDTVLCYLEKGMGAPIYVKSNISSKLFHLIDHAVAFGKDGSPIPINTTTNIDGNSNSIEYVEDLKVPPGSQIVLILLMPHSWYSRNTKELYSTYSCDVETLEALSYSVVCINETTWDETPIEEKTAMLMSKIRSKLAHD